mgnify:FL=1|tara:strand:+ start:1147 stop:2490 length:1344 start_codon:yes stop_codon:yes gene_type:complete
MIRKHQKFNRRSLLRGLVHGSAVAMGLPILDSFLNENGTAFAEDGAALPPCFGSWFWGLGLTPGLWEPKKIGADYELPEHIAVLNPIKQKLNVYSGLQVFLDGKVNQNHMSGAQGQMTGIVTKSAAEYDESFDAIIDRQFRTNVRFRSLEVACDGNASSGWTARGRNGKTPYQISPMELYKRIYGDGFQDPNQAEFKADPEVMIRHSVLSAVTEQRQQLLKSVSVNDRSRLDEYFTSLRDVEQKLAFELDRPAALPACSVPSLEADEIGTLVSQVQNTHKQFALLLSHALACGQTRIFHVTLGNAFSTLRLPGEPSAYHALTHEEPINLDLGYQPKCKELGERCMGFFLELIQTMDSIREGDGTLLDRSVVFAYTDHGEARLHSMKNMPVFTAGSGAGRIKTGMHVAAEGDAATRVGFTIQKSLGVVTDRWGAESNEVRIPYNEVLV